VTTTVAPRRGIFTRSSENMDSTALRYFQVAAEFGSIRGAAQTLHVSASAISRQIARLEDQLGVPLFERQPSGLAMTSAGELLLFHVRRTNRELQEAQREIRELAGKPTGHVRIVVVESAARGLLGPALEQFWKQHPKVRVSLHVAGTHEVVDYLDQGESDIGVAFNIPLQVRKHVKATALLPIGAIMSACHPLAGATSLRIRDIAHFPLFLPDPSLMLHKALSRVPGFAPERVHLITNSIAAMSLLASCSQGIALKTRLGMEDEIARGALVFIPVVDPRLSSQELALLVSGRNAYPVLVNGIARMIASLHEGS
jgi:DNA-binding transcriptional LysR family regulator